MNFTAPMPFKEALQAAEVKSPLLTTGGTSDLQQLSSDIKRRALFSARVTTAELLQKIDDGVNAILTGQSDQATERAAIKDLLEQLGYQPDPEKAGGIQDLSSTPRIDVQLETNVDTARGYGWWMQGQQQDVLDEYPAQELVRFSEPKGGVSAERDWAARWQKVDGQFYGERMIALKNDPIWDKLGDPDIFDDGLGNPYPPYAFNSGMNVRDVGRDEAIELGLIDDNTELMPEDVGLNDSLQASPDIRSDDLRKLLEESGLGSFNADGVFEFDHAASSTGGEGG